MLENEVTWSPAKRQRQWLMLDSLIVIEWLVSADLPSNWNLIRYVLYQCSVFLFECLCQHLAGNYGYHSLCVFSMTRYGDRIINPDSKSHYRGYKSSAFINCATTPTVGYIVTVPSAQRQFLYTAPQPLRGATAYRHIYSILVQALFRGSPGKRVLSLTLGAITLR